MRTYGDPTLQRRWTGCGLSARCGRSAVSSPLAGPPPRCIYLIRHGEKPADPGDDEQTDTDPDPAGGVDFAGTPNQHSLTPRGWQRSGALAVLFTHTQSDATPLSVPGQLFAPRYGSGDTETAEHRPYQTVLALSALIAQTIRTPCQVGQEVALAHTVLASTADTVLICWEHQNIPAILDAISAAVPITPGPTAASVPTHWPGKRFNLIWQLCRTNANPTTYQFTQIPQAVLAGDENAPT